MEKVKSAWSVAGFVASLLLVMGSLVVLGACSPKRDSLTIFMSQDCLQCHGSANKFPVAGAKAGYAVSGHAVLGNSFYSNGGGCQRCHTHEGFVEYIDKGSIDPQSFVDTPSQPACFTCHDPHKTGDFTLRVTSVMKLDNGEAFDAGKGNLCSACHRARGDAAKTVVEMDAARVSPNFGAHHGPQADMLAGTNAFEYEGKAYSSSAHTTVVRDTCIACHMALPQGRYGLSPEIGSHSFNLKGVVHGVEQLNTAACLSCHKDVAQVQGTLLFNNLAAADFDNDAKVEPLQLEVRGLLEVLVNTGGSGLLQHLSPPMYRPDGTWNTVREGKRTKNEVAALFNYKFVLEDRSLGIHNARYAVQILYDTIASLSPSFDVSKRPR